jgi:NAD(P)H dehydrogenase (quinone)
MKVLILYHTKTGHTLEAANATADGIRAAGSEVDVVVVKSFDTSRISDYDALIVGSPCWSGSVPKKGGISKPVKKMLDTLEPGILKGKKCGIITVQSIAGGESTLRSIGEILIEKGCDGYKAGPVATAGVPLSLWKGPSVKTEDQEIFRKFGSEFVQ